MKIYLKDGVRGSLTPLEWLLRLYANLLHLETELKEFVDPPSIALQEFMKCFKKIQQDFESAKDLKLFHTTLTQFNKILEKHNTSIQYFFDMPQQFIDYTKFTMQLNILDSNLNLLNSYYKKISIPEKVNPRLLGINHFIDKLLNFKKLCKNFPEFEKRIIADAIEHYKKSIFSDENLEPNHVSEKVLGEFVIDHLMDKSKTPTFPNELTQENIKTERDLDALNHRYKKTTTRINNSFEGIEKTAQDLFNDYKIKLDNKFDKIIDKNLETTRRNLKKIKEKNFYSKEITEIVEKCEELINLKESFNNVQKKVKNNFMEIKTTFTALEKDRQPLKSYLDNKISITEVFPSEVIENILKLNKTENLLTAKIHESLSTSVNELTVIYDKLVALFTIFSNIQDEISTSDENNLTKRFKNLNLLENDEDELETHFRNLNLLEEEPKNLNKVKFDINKGIEEAEYKLKKIKYKNLLGFIAKYGMVYQSIPENGNCLFAAIAYQLLLKFPLGFPAHLEHLEWPTASEKELLDFGATKKELEKSGEKEKRLLQLQVQKLARTLRDFTVTFMIANKSNFSHLDLSQEFGPEWDGSTSFATYCNYLAKDNTWGGECALLALSLFLKLDILIIHPDLLDKKPTPLQNRLYRSDSSNLKIFNIIPVLYNGYSHYDCPKNKITPEFKKFIEERIDIPTQRCKQFFNMYSQSKEINDWYFSKLPTAICINTAKYYYSDIEKSIIDEIANVYIRGDFELCSRVLDLDINAVKLLLAEKKKFASYEVGISAFYNTIPQPLYAYTAQKGDIPLTILILEELYRNPNGKQLITDFLIPNEEAINKIYDNTLKWITEDILKKEYISITSDIEPSFVCDIIDNMFKGNFNLTIKTMVNDIFLNTYKTFKKIQEVAKNTLLKIYQHINQFESHLLKEEKLPDANQQLLELFEYFDRVIKNKNEINNLISKIDNFTVDDMNYFAKQIYNHLTGKHPSTLSENILQNENLLSYCAEKEAIRHYLITQDNPSKFFEEMYRKHCKIEIELFDEKNKNNFFPSEQSEHYKESSADDFSKKLEKEPEGKKHKIDEISPHSQIKSPSLSII